MSIIRAMVSFFEYMYLFYIAVVYPLIFEFRPLQWFISLIPGDWFESALQWLADNLGGILVSYDTYVNATTAEYILCIGSALVLVFGILWFLIDLVDKVIP